MAAPVAELVQTPTPAPSAPAVIDRGGLLDTKTVIARTLRIREVMEAVMKDGVHYGVIPGTQKPTIYQPGADVLAVTFRITPKIHNIEDLSMGGNVRYRILVQGVNQVTGELLAEGMGECSSDEEKYRWRRAVCKEEFDGTDPDGRREKWGKDRSGKGYKVQQIRTSPADVANTVLKMAVKRGKIAMILNATAASDVFAQDLEDLSEELRESLAGEQAAAPAAPQPGKRVSEQAKTETTKPAEPAESAPTAKPPVSAPAKPPTAKPIGLIVKTEIKGEKGDAVLVTLDTGFKCTTRDPELQQSVGNLVDTKRRVELLTRPSSDPSKYAPVLTGIEFPVDEEPAS